MDDLIIYIGNEAVLDPKAAYNLEHFEKTMKELKARQEELRAKLLEEMKAKKIKSIGTEHMTISYTEEHDSIRFDSKAFKADHPDLYDDYLTVSKVKDSVKVTLR